MVEVGAVEKLDGDADVVVEVAVVDEEAEQVDSLFLPDRHFSPAKLLSVAKQLVLLSQVQVGLVVAVALVHPRCKLERMGRCSCPACPRKEGRHRPHPVIGWHVLRRNPWQWPLVPRREREKKLLSLK